MFQTGFTLKWGRGGGQDEEGEHEGATREERGIKDQEEGEIESERWKIGKKDYWQVWRNWKNMD